MFLTGWRLWLDNLARLAGRRPRRGRRPLKRRKPYLPLLEPLEVRWVPSISSIMPQPIAATEGTAFTGTVASFATSTPGDAFTASIAWGDGTVSPGSVVATGPGQFAVTGSHTYADEATGLAATVTVQDTTDNTSATVNDTATVAEADTLSPQEVTTGTIQENQFVGGTAAVWKDPGYPTNDPADFSASFDWGDGTTYSTGAGNARVTSDGAGDFTLSVSGHTYVDEGTYTVVATLADDSPGGVTSSQIGTLTAAETDTLVAAGTQPSPTVREGDGAASNTVAVFSDNGFPNNDPADFTATIDWGDGTSGPGTVNTAGDGNFTVSGRHAYSEDGTFTVTTTLADDSPGTAVATATTSAHVAESPLTVNGTSVSATEGTSFSGQVATFTDGNTAEPANDYSAQILWGDGSSSAGTVTQPGGAGTPFQVLGSHAYTEEGAYTATVVVTDDAGSASPSNFTGSAQVSVANASLAVTATPVGATEGATFSGQVATFTDAGGLEANADYSATIDWGDGTTTAGTVSGGMVNGSHAYGEEGSFTVAVTVTDDPNTADAVTASDSAAATVADASLTATPGTVSATQGTTFSGVVASFTDADPNGVVGDYSATINWGDGTTTTGTVGGSAAGGGFQVSGQHAYLQAGSYKVQVVIRDQGGSAATAGSSASVAVAPFALTAFPQQGFEGLPMNNVLVATFAHGGGAEPAALFSASVNWGDGTTSPGTVTQGSDGIYSVTASHTFLDEPALGLILPGTRLFPLTVSVRDASSASSARAAGVVLEPLPPGSTGVTPLTPNGTANGRYAAELFNDLTGDHISAALVNRWVASLRHHSRRTLVSSLLTDSLLRSLHIRAAQAGGGSSSAALVEGYYRLFLDRPADPSGLSTGLRKLQQGGESALVAFLLSSDEYVSKTVLGGG